MKKTRFILLGLSLLAFTSCNNVNQESAFSILNIVKVVIEDNDYFSVNQNVYEINRGEDLNIFITFKDGFTFDFINYENYEIINNTNNIVEIKLKNVTYSLRVKINVKKVESIISYYPNGGEFLSEEYKENECVNVVASIKNHLRANVSIGTDFVYRKGYVQVGWNTESDYSGTHVGLGSRITLTETNISLYAQWVKYTTTSYFRYQEVNDGYKIISYNGPLTLDTLCIPEVIGGKNVVELESNLFWNVEFNNVILPSSIKRLNKNTFAHFKIGTLTFFDNIESISDDCFNNESIYVVDIQANLKPSFLSGNNNAQFSENLDRLIVEQDKKKIVFFAGCSFSYGLKSEEIVKAFPDYDVFNMGVIGGTLASFQIDIISSYLKEGDIFVHAPEEMSEYQLLSSYEMEMRSFIMVEANYDLLHNTSFSNVTNFFDAFSEYTQLKRRVNSQSYDYHNDNYNKYGDIIIDRPNSSDDAYFDIETCFEISCLNETTASNLNSTYKSLKDKGVEVYFSYAPINENAIHKLEGAAQNGNYYENFIINNITEAKIISKLSNYIMKGKYFYDEDYHLSDEGAYIRTNNLIEDIKNERARM